MHLPDLTSTALRYHNGQLSLLDQRQLPQYSHWLTLHHVDDLIAAIQSLAIRGAPLIGIAAAVFLAHLAQQAQSKQIIEQAGVRLQQARPTAVNLMHCIEKMHQCLPLPHWREALIQCAVQLWQQDQALCTAIAHHGVTLIPHRCRLLTHCNTGSLATVGSGTALGIISAAHHARLQPSVWVDETRPLLQGARLTAWELQQQGIDYHLICDNMAASLMAQGQVDCVLVGADRIAANGDFANKIGTYALAVLAQYHRIPFYVAAPSTTIDPDCANGVQIPIEQRDAQEVRGLFTVHSHCQWAPQSSPVFNPAFDVTPAQLVSRWITDQGCYDLPAVQQGVFSQPGKKQDTCFQG